MYKKLGYGFNALYVGGGTPTVLVDELERTIALIKDTYDIKEISVETNPNHLTSGNINVLKNIGVNRLSVGVQTFDDSLLKLIERYHKYGSGQEIAERLKFTMGQFQTLNVDMIFNFPTQTMNILEEDLSTLIDSKVDQVTYYPLMVSSYTHDMMNKKLGHVDYDRGKEFYEKITEMLFPQYAPSTAWCFSRKERMAEGATPPTGGQARAPIIDEYVVNYDEYAGLGSGSIGYLDGSAYANTFDIGEYIGRINKGLLPVTAKKTFSLKERLCYDFLMKLFGMNINIGQLSAKHHVNAYLHLLPEISFFRLTGGLEKQGDILSLTKKGQYYWVLMMREFFIGVNNFRDYCREQLGTDR